MFGEFCIEEETVTFSEDSELDITFSTQGLFAKTTDDLMEILYHSVPLIYDQFLDREFYLPFTPKRCFELIGNGKIIYRSCQNNTDVSVLNLERG